MLVGNDVEAPKRGNRLCRFLPATPPPTSQAKIRDSLCPPHQPTAFRLFSCFCLFVFGDVDCIFPGRSLKCLEGKAGKRFGWNGQYRIQFCVLHGRCPLGRPSTSTTDNPKGNHFSFSHRTLCLTSHVHTQGVPLILITAQC